MNNKLINIISPGGNLKEFRLADISSIELAHGLHPEHPTKFYVTLSGPFSDKSFVAENLVRDLARKNGVSRKDIGDLATRCATNADTLAAVRHQLNVVFGPLPRWLQVILDHQSRRQKKALDRRNKELAELSVRLAQVKDELAAAREVGAYLDGYNRQMKGLTPMSCRYANQQESQACAEGWNDASAGVLPKYWTKSSPATRMGSEISG